MNDQPCGCALQCFDNIPSEQREKTFSGFWGLGDFNVQNAYLCGCVKVSPVKKHNSPTSNRGNTRVFYINNGERSVRVCKVAFLRIHGVSNGRLYRVLAGQAQQGGLPKLDKRGRKQPPNKTSEEDILCVREHIKSFPVYESHYSRADNPNRQYLSPHLSITQMYYLYKEVCTQEEKRAVSEWVYRREFNEHFNLSFGRYTQYSSLSCMCAFYPSAFTVGHNFLFLPYIPPSLPPSLPPSPSRPKTDTCKTCDAMKARLDSESDTDAVRTLKGQWELHKHKAERAYHQLREDTAQSQGDPNLDVITFDLQQSLPTPLLSVKVVFYKRQL